MKTSLRLALPALLATLFPLPLVAQTSPIFDSFSYQGRVTRADGIPVGQNQPVSREIIIRIYGAPTGGTPLFAEKQNAIIFNGEFSIIVGEGTLLTPPNTRLSIAITGTVPSSGFWMGVTVDDGELSTADPEISPRQKILAAPFAVRAATAENLAAVTQDMRLNNRKFFLSTGTDTNAALEMATALNPFGSSLASGGGPLLYGNSGGVLGTKNTSGELTALQWGENSVNITNRLGINYATPANETLVVRQGVDSQTSVFKVIKRDNSPILSIESNGAVNVSGKLRANSLFLRPDNDNNAVDFFNNGARLYGAAGGQLGAFNGVSYSTALVWNGAGNVGIGTDAPITRLDVRGDIQVGGTSSAAGFPKSIRFGDADNCRIGEATTDDVLELKGAQGISMVGNVSMGGNVTANGNVDAIQIRVGLDKARESNAGKISYGAFTLGTLEIVGAGTTAGNRKITMFAEGGTTFNGPIVLEGATKLPQYLFGPNADSYTNNSSVNNDGSNAVDVVLNARGGRVVADAFTAVSDARLKKITGVSNGANDLAMLTKLQITDYVMKDDASQKPRQNKKVIAQQVEAIFPQAVSTTEGPVPDLLTTVTAKEGLVTLKKELPVAVKKGDLLKVYAANPKGGETSSMVTKVVGVTKDDFQLEDKLEGRVFLYGHQVKDVRTVDYEAIAMLNVSATQEIKKELDAEVKERDAEIHELRTENATLRAALEKAQSSFETRLAALEKALPESGAAGAAKTVSTSTQQPVGTAAN